MTRNEFRATSSAFRVELRNGEGRAFKSHRKFYFGFRTNAGHIAFSTLGGGIDNWAGYMPLIPGVSKQQRKVMLGIVRSRCAAPVPLPR